MTEVIQKTVEKTYNAYFMKEIFDYINTRNYSKQNIVIFDNELLEEYAKKQFVEVYLPGTHQLIWSTNKTTPRKEKTEFLDINDKFIEQFAKEYNLKLDEKINYDHVMKQKPKNETKKFVSDYIIKELVDRMILQYDKQDIIENEVKDFNIRENQLPENKTIEECSKKEQYKCEIQYGKFLSHVRDQLNDLKSSYVNMLKIILKSINNQAIKVLQEQADKDNKFFKITNVQNNKKVQIKQIEVKGSGKTFLEKCHEIIHNVLKEFQEKVIDTKNKKTQFYINKKSFEKLTEIYNKIQDYKEDITPITYDITALTTFINRQIKFYTNGVSIPVTQYYIKEYLPTIISYVINRLNIIGKKIDEKMIFELDNVNQDILDNININIVKVISYTPINEKPEDKVE